MDDLRYIARPHALAAIEAGTADLQLSMASDPLVGSLLRALAASKPHGCFLERGTETGIATAWLLDGMDGDSTLVSVDNDGAVQQVARDALGVDERLTLMTSGGLEYLRTRAVSLGVTGSLNCVLAKRGTGDRTDVCAIQKVKAQAQRPLPKMPRRHGRRKQAKTPILQSAEVQQIMAAIVDQCGGSHVRADCIASTRPGIV